MPEGTIGPSLRRYGGRDGRAGTTGSRGRYHSVAAALEVGTGAERDEEEACCSDRRDDAGDGRRHEGFWEVFLDGL